MKVFHHRVLRWAGVVAASLLFLLFIFDINVPRTHAENERVVTIYHDGIEQTVVTDATTVSDVLKRVDVTLGKYDNVEPAKDTVLTAPSYSINVYRARPVTIVDGLDRYEVMTAATSAGEIVHAANLALYPEDKTTLERIDDFVGDGGVGLKLTIHRATPVNFVLYGKQFSVRTQSQTVGDLLKEKDVTLGPADGVNLAMNTHITSDLTVQVWRNGVQTVTEEQPVAFATEFIRDADKPVGYKQVQTPGVLGKKVVTYQVEMRDGHELNRTQIQSVVTDQPQKEVTVIGVQVGFAGPFQDALAKLRMCEAGGHYDRNSGNGYYGAYQFDITTWGGYQGYARADLAPPEVQDQKVWETYQRRGWRPWPTCSAKLGLQDVYR